ncbi:hypothetical protein HUU53_03190 [Candidatus Micrarchaeota archaeon]|nr:hypothetical protein [Candidatus Micrarchaeota archaeon]
MDYLWNRTKNYVLAIVIGYSLISTSIALFAAALVLFFLNNKKPRERELTF